MNTDLRVSISFRGHRKRKKLRMLIGASATDCLLDLWLAAAVDRPDGVLSNLDDLDIALMSGWEGEPPVFVEALLQVGFLDRRAEDDCLVLHDWTSHNGYASAATARSEAASKAAKAKWAKRIPTESIPPIVPEQCGIDAGALLAHKNRIADARAPSPSPSPSPSPLPNLETSSTRTKNELLFLEVFVEKEILLKELFPQHNYEVIKEGCLAHYRSSPPALDPYVHIYKWFQRQQSIEPSIRGDHGKPRHAAQKRETFDDPTTEAFLSNRPG